MTQAYYGTIDDANAYFAERLHEVVWSDTSDGDRVKALKAATRRIDALNFKGQKHTVWLAQQASPDTTSNDEWISLYIAATGGKSDAVSLIGGYSDPPIDPTDELAQELEFPRGSDIAVPSAIERACYEIAYSLLDGKDPELALEAIAVSSQAYSSVRTSYNRDQKPLAHVMNLIPSAIAWAILVPFLRDDNYVEFSRVS